MHLSILFVFFIKCLPPWAARRAVPKCEPVAKVQATVEASRQCSCLALRDQILPDSRAIRGARPTATGDPKGAGDPASTTTQPSDKTGVRRLVGVEAPRTLQVSRLPLCRSWPPKSMNPPPNSPPTPPHLSPAGRAPSPALRCRRFFVRADSISSAKPQIVLLKLDDVTGGRLGPVPVSDRWQRIADYLTSNHIKGSFGIICESLEQDESGLFQMDQRHPAGGSDRVLDARLPHEECE